MEQFESWVTSLSNLVWGPHLLILLIGTGVYLTFRLGFIQVTRLGFGLKEAFIPKPKTGAEAEKQKKQRGDISHFQALMTALAATVGTGNMSVSRRRSSSGDRAPLSGCGFRDGDEVRRGDPRRQISCRR